MAERRMFARSIINSARFLRMPPTSRLLYYDLGMAADDDGVVEAFTVLRTTGAAEDDLRVLVSKNFVRVLNEDLVSLIVDWKSNNLIKSDRYHPSQYQALLVSISDGNEPEPIWNSSGSKTEPEVRGGKIRSGEGRQGKTECDAVFEDFAGEDDRLLSALRDFEAMRRSIKKPLTPRAKELLTGQLKRDFRRDEWIDVLNQSVVNSWQGIFPLKDGKQTKTQQGQERTVDRLARLTKEGRFSNDTF